MQQTHWKIVFMIWSWNTLGLAASQPHLVNHFKFWDKVKVSKLLRFIKWPLVTVHAALVGCLVTGQDHFLMEKFLLFRQETCTYAATTRQSISSYNREVELTSLFYTFGILHYWGFKKGGTHFLSYYPDIIHWLSTAVLLHLLYCMLSFSLLQPPKMCIWGKLLHLSQTSWHLPRIGPCEWPWGLLI